MADWRSFRTFAMTSPSTSRIRSRKMFGFWPSEALKAPARVSSLESCYWRPAIARRTYSVLSSSKTAPNFTLSMLSAIAIAALRRPLLACGAHFLGNFCRYIRRSWDRARSTQSTRRSGSATLTTKWTSLSRSLTSRTSQETNPRQA